MHSGSRDRLREKSERIGKKKRKKGEKERRKKSTAFDGMGCRDASRTRRGDFQKEKEMQRSMLKSSTSLDRFSSVHAKSSVAARETGVALPSRK